MNNNKFTHISELVGQAFLDNLRKRSTIICDICEKPLHKRNVQNGPDDYDIVYYCKEHGTV